MSQCPRAKHPEKEVKVCKAAAAPLTERNQDYTEPVLQLPRFIRMLGKKHAQIALAYVPSTIIYGVASLIVFTYMAEWKTVLQYMPFYSGKYRVEEEAAAKPAPNETAENSEQVPVDDDKKEESSSKPS